MENQSRYHALGSICLSISIVYAFLKNNLVDVMLNPLRKKRIRVDAMPNSLLREINSLRHSCPALRLANIEYLDMVVALCILFTLFEYD